MHARLRIVQSMQRLRRCSCMQRTITLDSVVAGCEDPLGRA